MSRLRCAALFVCSFAVPLAPILAQQPPASPLDSVAAARFTARNAAAHLQHSLAAQIGATPVADVTLTGTVRRIAGSDDDTGSATLKALHTGEARIDLNLPGGTLTEAVSIAPEGPHGFWRGADGKSHSIANHNLFTDSAWFFPALLLRRALASPHQQVTVLGEETRNDRPVFHLVLSQKFPEMPAEHASTFERLSQMDLFLDPATHLPVALVFNIHPDNNLLQDIPVEIRYSDYRPLGAPMSSSASSGNFVAPGFSPASSDLASGSTSSSLATNHSPLATSPLIPMHIEKFLNNTLLLDLHFDSASLNSGLNASQVGAQ